MLSPELFGDGQVYVAALQTERERANARKQGSSSATPKVRTRYGTRGFGASKRRATSRSTAGQQRHTALSHAVISSDVAGLAAMLDDAKLHSNNSEHAARFLLGLS
jgi:hypothetical protein